MSNFDSYYYIYKDAIGKWDMTNNPKFIARHTYCRAIPKHKVKDLDHLHYICKKLSSSQDTFTKRYLIEELDIFFIN